MKKVIAFMAVFFACALSAYAQPSVARLKRTIDAEETRQPKGLRIRLINSTQAAVRFGKNTSGITVNQVIPWLSQRLALRQNDDMLLDENRDVIIPGNIAVKKIHQYYRGIKLEHGVINATSKNGQLAMMQLEFYSVPDGFDTRPAISEEAALEKAMAFANAQVYAWQLGDTLDEDRQKPVGELVIINNYESDSGKVCLAYKFNIYGLQPLYRAFVYVNAHTGKVVLEDMIIKHAKARNSDDENTLQLPPGAPLHNLAPPVDFNEPINNAAATADTRYNGRRPILADLYSGTDARPYRLRAIRNNHNIIVLNYEKHDYPSLVVPSYESTAPDFTDNNNDWTSAEYNNSNMDNGALDVMDNMIWVSDYWKGIHNRNSWNNSNGSVISYVHVYKGSNPWDNAQWNGKYMLFGDGNGATGTDFTPVQTSLDDCAHELAHGVTSSTAGLVYRWESGALNESLSDIWAACVTNYAKQSAGLSSELPWRLFEKTTDPLKPVPGARDMQNPVMAPFRNPSTYHSLYWQAGDRVACPTPDQSSTSAFNDMCGVHNNSGVLNKWFYLITAGETGTNSKGKNYSITGLGFAKSEKITYLMELNLTPNASYTTAMTVSLEAAFSLYDYGSPEYSTVKAAWAAVGVDTASVFNKANTPVFTTNNFTCVVPAYGDFVFAGTNYGGFYQYDGKDWIKRPELTDVRINDLKCDDRDDWIWIAQSGQLGQSGGGSSLAGGVNVLKYPYVGEVPLFYTVSPTPEVPSRNARCMYVDKWRIAEGFVPKVWVATLAYITSGNSTSGMLGQGLYSTYKQFTPVSEGMNLSAGTIGCLTVGGNKNEVWTFVQANFGVNQLLVYNAQTNTLITTYDHNSVPLIPSGFVARAIYGDAFNRMWIGLANGGMLVFDENRQWHLINFSNIFPTGSSVTFNAITGNSHGDIYVGTNFGLVYYAGGGLASRIDLPENYRLYGKTNGLMSNNINAVAYDKNEFKLWVATDSGLIKWDPPCIGKGNCLATPGSKNAFSATAKKGNWSDTATWDSGQVPDSSTVVFITDSVTVDINAQCNTISVVKPGNLTVNTGKSLKIYSTSEPIYTRQRKRQKRQQ